MSSTYVVFDSFGVVIGTFASLVDAQTEAQTLANAYVSSDPNLSVQNTSTFYAAVLLRTITRDISGISLTTTQQSIGKSWTINTLVNPT